MRVCGIVLVPVAGFLLVRLVSCCDISALFPAGAEVPSLFMVPAAVASARASGRALKGRSSTVGFGPSALAAFVVASAFAGVGARSTLNSFFDFSAARAAAWAAALG